MKKLYGEVKDGGRVEVDASDLDIMIAIGRVGNNAKSAKQKLETLYWKIYHNKEMLAQCGTNRLTKRQREAFEALEKNKIFKRMMDNIKSELRSAINTLDPSEDDPEFYED